MADPVTPVGTTPDPTKDGGKEGGTGGSNETPKTLTQEQANAILQKRLGEEKVKAQEDKDTAVQAAIDETNRLAALSQKEREAEYQKKQDEDYKNRVADLALKQNKYDFIDKFTEAKIPVNLIDLILDKDRNVMETKFQALKVQFAEAVKNGVADQLKGKQTLPDPQGNPSKTEDIKVIL